MLALLVAGSAGCSPWPTEREIGDSLEAQLRSVAGEWTATSLGADLGVLSVRFRLEEAGGTALRGTGSMQERGAAGPVAVTVAGSYDRPVLALTLDGMVFEGRAVRGTVRGGYTSVGGVSDTLVLSGEGYTRRIPVLLQEQP